MSLSIPGAFFTFTPAIAPLNRNIAERSTDGGGVWNFFEKRVHRPPEGRESGAWRTAWVMRGRRFLARRALYSVRAACSWLPRGAFGLGCTRRRTHWATLANKDRQAVSWLGGREALVRCAPSHAPCRPLRLSFKCVQWTESSVRVRCLCVRRCLFSLGQHREREKHKKKTQQGNNTPSSTRNERMPLSRHVVESTD